MGSFEDDPVMDGRDDEVPKFDGERPEPIRLAQLNKQATRNRSYQRAYGRWLRSLTPEERERVEEMGLAKAADVGFRAHKEVDIDVERMADRQSPEQMDEFHAAMAEALSEFLHWLIMPPGQRGLCAKSIGCRAIMACWVLRPDVIGNLSTLEIASLVDTRPEVLSRQATAFSRRFGIRGRTQFNEATRARQRAAAYARIEAQSAQIHGPN